jgi:hypothetical protein
MDGDGLMDLVGTFPDGTRLFPGDGGTGVRAAVRIYGVVGGQVQIPAGTWDANTTPDLLMRDGNALVFYPGNGPAGLLAPRALPVNLAPYDWVIGVGALEVNGHPDLVVRNPANGALYAIQADAKGNVMKPRLLGSGYGGYNLAG